VTLLESSPTLTDQVYNAIVDEICDGRLEAGTHLVQERLAARYGISRQPIQQAMARLKADGMVEELGRRGLFVAPLDTAHMRDHYGIRAALDGWAAKMAASRIAQDSRVSAQFEQDGQDLLEAGRTAVASGGIAGQVQLDYNFHALIYRASGNEMIATTCEPHWRFLRRAMGAVLRKVASPDEIWRQHRAIFEAILAGDVDAAERLAVEHDQNAGNRLASVLEQYSKEKKPK
jgi:DNA-binding GntR family transcriptional regulator